MEQISPEATAWNTWAEYYDLADGDRAPYVAFYSSLLTDRTRSILELGCGTGRIVSALGQRIARRDQRGERARLVGVDGSVEMLRVARSRDAQVEWIFGDMRAPPVQGRFDLVYCCYNTLQHLLRDEDLLQAFRAARELIADDGVFAFDLYQPNLRYLSSPQTNRMARAIKDPRGRHLEIREDHVYEPQAQIATFSWRLIDRDQPEAAPLARTRYRFRQYFASDLLRLVAQAGLAIRARYGDFDRSRFSEESKKQILVCARA